MNLRGIHNRIVYGPMDIKIPENTNLFAESRSVDVSGARRGFTKEHEHTCRAGYTTVLIVVTVS